MLSVAKARLDSPGALLSTAAGSTLAGGSSVKPRDTSPPGHAATGPSLDEATASDATDEADVEAAAEAEGADQAADALPPALAIASAPPTINELNQLLLSGLNTRSLGEKHASHARDRRASDARANESQHDESESAEQPSHDEGMPSRKTEAADPRGASTSSTSPSNAERTAGKHASHDTQADATNNQSGDSDLRDERKNGRSGAETSSSSHASGITGDASSAGSRSNGAEAALAALKPLELPRMQASIEPKSSTNPGITGLGTTGAKSPAGSAEFARAAQAGSLMSARTTDAKQDERRVSLQLLRGVATALAKDPSGGSALITLRPESLGEVKVRVDVRGGVVTATFDSDNKVAHDLLGKSVVELRERLEAQGLTIDRLDVRLRDEQQVPSQNVPVHVSGTDAQDKARETPDGTVQDAPNHPAEHHEEPGGAGTSRDGSRHDSAGTPNSHRDDRAQRSESAEPVHEDLGVSDPAWRVSGFIDAIA